MKKLLLLALMIVGISASAQEGFTYNGKKLYPEKFAKTKNNAFASGLSYGIAKIKIKSYMAKPIARTRVATNPEFKLTIRQLVGSNIQIGQFWSAVQSPDEFVLVRFQYKKKTRMLITGGGSVYSGVNFSVDPEYHIYFEWDENEDGSFTIKTDLGPGEYAFIYAGSSNVGQNQAIYSFGVE